MSINFSIPNIPSLTKTKPDGTHSIFVPNISYLLKFSKGDLGIADSIRKNTILNTVASSNKGTSLTYLKSAGGIVDSPEKYLQNGKYIIPASAITLDPSKNQAGLKALEKSIIQSIFDSQKPYMDMFSQLGNVLITIEDIIARTLCLPEKSLKPSTNPRALGYKKNGESVTKIQLSQLDSLNSNNNNDSSQTNNDNLPNNTKYEVESIVYSTGEYNPNVEYTYEYIDIVNNSPVISSTISEDNNISNLPQTLIIAVFDNEGNFISNDDINNNVCNLSWLKSSGKWFGNFNYLDSNDSNNVTLFTQYYNDYTSSNLPSSMDATDKQNAINQINALNAANNYKNIKDQISSLKTDCYFKSVQFSNSSLLTATNSTGIANNIIFSNPFAPQKMNINGTNMWIDPESDYDLKLIRCDVANKTNDNDISKNTPFVTDVYGLDDNNNESIGQIYRNINTDTSKDQIFDLTGNTIICEKTYYIIEGILSTNNSQSYDNLNGNSNSFSYYRKKDFFTSIKQFINLIIQIASKLTPTITAITNIASNPSQFITNIMKLNLGDNGGTKDVKFIFFSTEFMNKYNSLVGSDNKSNIINTSILKNFVNLNANNTYKFLLSGSGFAYLNNIKIGLTVNPDMSFSTFSNTYPSTTPVTNSSNINNGINYNTLKFTSYSESETIDYIGGYNPDITYQYIYVNQTVLNILQDAQNSENSGDINSALSKYAEALSLDPSNTTISDKISALQKLVDSYGGNALFSFILNMITLPLEIVIGTVSEIVKIIKGFTSPTSLQNSISDLVSFKVFPGGKSPVDFFTSTGILSLAKITFNINLFMTWISTILVNPLEVYDLNKIIQLPFVTSFPKYSTTEFKSLIFGHKGVTPNILPLKLLSGILKIFEGIINAIISFFWELMGIGGLLEQPVISFTKDSNTNISASDIQALLDGTYTDVIDPNAPSPNYNFIYNIQLPDGKTIKQLNSIELQNFIEQNTNFQYQDNF